jgi:hypothetical protein
MTMILNIRCCCNPKRILGTVELPFDLYDECDVIHEGKVLMVRNYYQNIRGEHHMELAVKAAHGDEAA